MEELTGFVMTWGWVINDWIFIFVWTIPTTLNNQHVLLLNDINSVHIHSYAYSDSIKHGLFLWYHIFFIYQPPKSTFKITKLYLASSCLSGQFLARIRCKADMLTVKSLKSYKSKIAGITSINTLKLHSLYTLKLYCTESDDRKYNNIYFEQAKEPTRGRIASKGVCTFPMLV